MFTLTSLIIITFIASAIGGFTTASFKEPWYSQIILPSFNPPSWVFAPVWSTLYVIMSVAIWKIWINFFDIKILKIYFVHLFFNSTWSIVFFGFHQIGLALINLIIILYFIIILISKYQQLLYLYLLFLYILLKIRFLFGSTKLFYVYFFYLPTSDKRAFLNVSQSTPIPSK